MVLRSGLPLRLKHRLRTAFRTISAELYSPTLAGFGLDRFVPITYEHYAVEEQALRECERLLDIHRR